VLAVVSAATCFRSRLLGRGMSKSWARMLAGGSGATRSTPLLCILLTARHSVGQHPYGHRPGGRGADSAEHPDELVVVQRITHLRREGASYRNICSLLDAEGHRPRRAANWSPMSVRRIAERAGAVNQ
jgi:hypothetical protein